MTTVTAVTAFGSAEAVCKIWSRSSRLSRGAGAKVKGYGLYCLAAISTRRYAPLTFDPAPRDSRDDRDDVSDTAPALKKAVTAVTVVTPGAVPASG